MIGRVVVLSLLEHQLHQGLSLQSLRTSPVCGDDRSILVKIGATSLASSLRTGGGMPSGPAALVGFRLDRFSTP